MPRIVDAEQKKAEIAKAAIRLFAARGFENTTIQDIARSAGIGKGTVYHYFSSKNEILIHASQMIFSEIESSAGSSLLNVADPVDRISTLVLDTLNINETLEQIFIIYLELWLVNLRSRTYGKQMKMLERVLNDFRELISGIIREGILSGKFRKDADPKAIGIYITACIDGIGLHYMFDRKRFNIKDISGKFVDDFLKGILSEKTDR